MLFVVFFLCIFAHRAVGALLCLHCGGRNFSDGLKLSIDDCCHVSIAVCSEGQVCIRAFVSAPHSNFFLSGCHYPEDGLIGCDMHQLPMNATVHRCVCPDSKCQLQFPKSCSPSPVSTDSPNLVYNKNTENFTQTTKSHHHHNHHHHTHHNQYSHDQPPDQNRSTSSHPKVKQTHHHRHSSSVSSSKFPSIVPLNSTAPHTNSHKNTVVRTSTSTSTARPSHLIIYGEALSTTLSLPGKKQAAVSASQKLITTSSVFPSTPTVLTCSIMLYFFL